MILVRAPDVLGPSIIRLRSPPFALRLAAAAVLLLGARARRAAVQSGHPPVNIAVDKTRIRVPVHEGVDLQLRLVEGVRRRLHHVAVHDLPHLRVQTHLENETVTEHVKVNLPAGPRSRPPFAREYPAKCALRIAPLIYRPSSAFIGSTFLSVKICLFAVESKDEFLNENYQFYTVIYEYVCEEILQSCKVLFHISLYSGSHANRHT